MAHHHRFLSGLLALLALAPPLCSADWPSWRGPTADGVSTETHVPLRWSATENVRWKLPLPGPGNSTPITWKDRIFLTQATDEGKKRETWCVARGSGQVLWRQGVTFDGEEPTHGDNPYCAASPVTDGERVIALHGSAGIVCHDLDGKELWRREVGPLRHIWGNAASPVIASDSVFLNCGPGPRTFLLALDKRTGAEAWRVDVPGGLEDGGGEKWTGSWSTPLFLPSVAGDELIVSFPYQLRSFDPRSGSELWRCEGLGRLVYTSPVARDGIVVSLSGYMGPLMAVRLGGKGDVTATHRLWRQERGPQEIGSGVIVDGRLYLVNDAGAGQCLEASTGKTVWTERIGAQTWSSLVLAEGNLYSVDRDGQCTVYKAAPTLEVIARNELNERTRASVVISGGEVLIRTYQHLWSIGEGNSSAPQEESPPR